MYLQASASMKVANVLVDGTPTYTKENSSLHTIGPNKLFQSSAIAHPIFQVFIKRSQNIACHVCFTLVTNVKTTAGHTLYMLTTLQQQK